jgi:serine protease DegQ
VRRPWIGISVRDISPFIAERLGLQDRRGIVVWSLDVGSPADDAGIEVGDVIRAVNGRSVMDSSDARLQIFGAQVGETLTLSIERDGRLRDVSVRMREEPKERRGE